MINITPNLKKETSSQPPTPSCISLSNIPPLRPLKSRTLNFLHSNFICIFIFIFLHILPQRIKINITKKNTIRLQIYRAGGAAILVRHQVKFNIM